MAICLSTQEFHVSHCNNKHPQLVRQAKKVVRDVLLGLAMEMIERSPIVRNRALKRTISPTEVVEIRRRMARKSTPIPVQTSSSSRSKRATAELYLESCDSVAGVPAAPKRLRFALVAAAATATTTVITLGIVLAS